MTKLQEQKKEMKNLKAKLDIEYKKLTNRVEAYDREKRQLFLLQKNIENVQNLSEELLLSVEKIRLRGE